MSDTPRTDELSREFAGKRISSKEVSALYDKCRTLERQLAEIIKQRDVMEWALKRLKRALKRFERCFDRYECSGTAEEALDAVKGGSDE